MIKAVLFDLDGTLLPMDQREFIKEYFRLLCKKLSPFGYDSKQLIDAVWAGTAAMMKNDGTKSNEDVFWQYFCQVYPDRADRDRHIFDEFYAAEFDEAKSVCGFSDEAAETVRKIKAMGYRVALATNPVFPSVAAKMRVGWAGLSADDFELITSYENCRCCKPKALYYTDIAEALGIDPHECLMVGNDAEDDMSAEKAGMKVFLLTECLINDINADISSYPQGRLPDLLSFIEKLNVDMKQ